MFIYLINNLNVSCSLNMISKEYVSLKNKIVNHQKDILITPPTILISLEYISAPSVIVCICRKIISRSHFLIEVILFVIWNIKVLHLACVCIWSALSLFLLNVNIIRSVYSVEFKKKEIIGWRPSNICALVFFCYIYIDSSKQLSRWNERSIC
jgi:hypothetical protein